MINKEFAAGLFIRSLALMSERRRRRGSNLRRHEKRMKLLLERIIAVKTRQRQCVTKTLVMPVFGNVKKNIGKKMMQVKLWLIANSLFPWQPVWRLHKWYKWWLTGTSSCHSCAGVRTQQSVSDVDCLLFDNTSSAPRWEGCY